MDTKYTAKDFLLHIATIILLYSGTIALLNILFSVINVAFPQIDRYYGYYNGFSSISFPVAVLIVVFPLLLIITNIVRKGYLEDPYRKEYAVRKWLIYITLFIAGGVLAGDLITILYYFLDGRELTTAFILKFISVLVVIGSIFGYYLDDLKDRLTGSRRNMWRIVAVILVVGSIVAGFSVLGSPRTQRLIKYDEQRVNDLMNINSQIESFYYARQYLPSNLSELKESNWYQAVVDPQTGNVYEYNLIGQSARAYELCAEFNLASRDSVPSLARPGYGPVSWDHPAGRHCFQRTVEYLPMKQAI